MRIKRLDITGFKSFMERSVFQFDAGITGVVGPNGCGKSNVVDSIRWVMGEQSAKNLRGRGMEDVIFNGSETHAPLSMAEVTLTFAIEGHDTLPATLAGMTEVSVTRRLFRSGESEYQINKTTCRLLDITELFLGTGVGTKAYSIIEQGRVGQIVSARPEDRRTFIEEAAGVTKYKARRKAAERKMEHTQGNLLRVNDIVAELEKRSESLERQVKKAEKYKRLKGEARGLELHVQSHRWLELNAQRTMFEAQLQSLSGEERASYEKVKAGEEDVAARRAALEAEATALEQLAQEVYALESRVKLDAQNLSHWKADLAATTERVTRAQGEGEALAERRAELSREKEAREAELELLGSASKEDEVALAVVQEELRRTSELSVEVAARLEADRRELVEVATRLANHETLLSGLQGRRAELDQRIERVKGEAQVLMDEASGLEKARAEVNDRVGQTRQMALELAQRRGEEESNLQQVREAFAENEIHVISLREELSDKRSRLNSIEEIARNYEGFDRGVRAVMLKAGGDPRAVGVFGLVADVVSAPPRLEKAVEAALGSRLQHVIVESQEKGLELVAHLKELSEGRGTFLPVPSVSGAVLPALTLPQVEAMALTQVTVADGVLLPLVEQLLSGVAIVASLEQAREAAAQAPGYTFVTLEGEVLAPGGVVTGGVLEGPAVGALQKKREIAELQLEVARVEERYNEIVTRHYALQKQMGTSEGVLKGLARNQHAEELNLANQEKDLHQAGSTLSKLRERLGDLSAEQAQLQASLDLLLADEETSRGEVAHGQADRSARDERVRLLTGELETLRARAEALTAEQTTVRVRVASSSERGEAARREHEALATRGVELQQRLAASEQIVTEGRAQAQVLEERLAQTGEGQEEREAQLLAQSSQLTERKEKNHQGLTQVRDEEASLKELREKLDALTHGLSDLSIRERELKLELTHLEQQVEEKHGLPMAQAVHEHHTLPTPGPEVEVKLKELRVQLERMGEVNLTAIDEFKEVSERYQFLAKQKADLEDSLKQLEAAISKIDATSRERFKETFDIVNAKFESIFPRLFGGGRAGLVLTNEGPGQEPGVEIVAQPPGKKLQSVQLLSGGEKALTAVSMIFAIFLIKPTPFCLLDEVDAPLDEGNVGRYNDMVREMSKQSQFILITHNKRTMEVVDSLYGVTMEEPGISKLVSVKMREQVAANADQPAVA